MKYKIEFQYKELDDDRSEHDVQHEPIKIQGEFVPIPNVGDSMDYLYGGKKRYCNVVTRHFSYLGDWCLVNIVFTDISDHEMET